MQRKRPSWSNKSGLLNEDTFAARCDESTDCLSLIMEIIYFYSKRAPNESHARQDSRAKEILRVGHAARARLNEMRTLQASTWPKEALIFLAFEIPPQHLWSSIDINPG